MAWYCVRAVRRENGQAPEQQLEDLRLDTIDPAASWAGTARAAVGARSEQALMTYA